MSCDPKQKYQIEELKNDNGKQFNELDYDDGGNVIDMALQERQRET